MGREGRGRVKRGREGEGGTQRTALNVDNPDRWENFSLDNNDHWIYFGVVA